MTEKTKTLNPQTHIIRAFVEKELHRAKNHKRKYGWICKHFKHYYDGQISQCENLLMFIDTEVK